MKTDTDLAQKRWLRDRDVARETREREFEAISGFRRSTGNRKLFPKGMIENAPPGFDHPVQYFDPVSRCAVLADSPYPGRRSTEELAVWAKRHDWSAQKIEWGSIYGLGTELWLMAPNGRGLDLPSIALRFQSAPPATPDPNPPL